MTQGMGQRSPQGLPHFEGQRSPQRLGTPYSLLTTPFSLLPFRISSPSIRSTEGAATREAAPEQTVAPADEWMEDFDFEAEVPCGNPDCDRPADYVIRGHGSPLSFLACRPCRERLKPEKRWCPTNAALETADEHWEIVEVLR